MNATTETPASPKNSSHWMAIMGAAALALLIGYAIHVAWPILFPPIAHSVPHDPGCDLRAGDCRLAFPGGEKVTFRILPRTLPLIEPVQVEVALEGLQAHRVMVDFVGIGMNMGYNRPELKAQGDNRFAAQARIPVCVRNRMDWEARVMVDTADGLWVAPFRFFTLKE